MECSLEIAVKKIILTNYNTFHKPVGRKELAEMVRQKIGVNYSSVTFSHMLKQLKDGGAIAEDSFGCFTPNYERVEV